MSGLPLIIEPDAAADVREAMLWYETQATNLSEDFAREVERALEKIILNPTLYRVAHKPAIRRVLVSRFPFRIYYVISEDCIAVRAVLHASQDEWIVAQRVRSR